MTIFDQFFFSVFTYYKTSYKKKANTIAIVYITLLQISIMLVLGCFFAAFFQQMKVDTLTSENAWILFIVTSIVIYFKNWMSYNGKSRMVISAHMSNQKKLGYNIILLWLLPIAITALSLMLMNRFL